MSGTSLWTWSTTASNNDDSGGLFPEGQTRSSVNNSLRSVQAEMRTFANDPVWVNYGDGDEESTVAYASGHTFTIAGADVTEVWTAGRRVRAVGGSTGDIRGTIIGSSFSTDTTVTVDWDGTATLANESLTIYLSALHQEDCSLPRVALQKPNILHNGEFLVWQRGTSFTATGSGNDDDSYTADGCILLSDGNDIVDLTRDTSLAVAGYGYAICKLDVETANKKFGLLFPVENIHAKQLAGKRASLSFKARKDGSNSTLETIRAAVLQWTGTADSITSDVVSAWNSAGTNPTLATNWAYSSAPTSGVTLSTTLREYRFVNIGVSSSATNVAVFIWCDDTDATVADLAYIADVNLVEGEVGCPIMRRSFTEAHQLCKRYYQKTFPYATAAAQNAGVDGALTIRTDNEGDANIDWRFPVEMRTTPTVTTYNPSDTNANARNISDSTNLAVNGTFDYTVSASVAIGGNANDVNDRVAVHATAVAEL